MNLPLLRNLYPIKPVRNVLEPSERYMLLGFCDTWNAPIPSKPPKKRPAVSEGILSEKKRSSIVSLTRTKSNSYAHRKMCIYLNIGTKLMIKTLWDWL